MADVVVFDPAAWAQAFPAFATLPAPLAEQYFGLTGLYLDNSPNSIVQDVNLRRSLLYLLTAHIAQIFSPPGGDGANTLVGRINSATEGSVTVAADMPAADDAAWFNQTPYGAAFWQGTLRWRSARYAAAPPYAFGPIPWSRAGWRGGF